MIKKIIIITGKKRKSYKRRGNYRRYGRKRY